MKKTLLSISTIIVAFVLTISPTAKVEAQFTDPVQFTKEIIADPIVTVITQRILGKLVNDSVNWALGGFDGDPSFVGNWSQFLQDSKHDVLLAGFASANKYTSNINIGGKSKQQLQNEYFDCIESLDDILDQTPDADSYVTQADIDREYEIAEKECDKLEKKLNKKGNSEDKASQNYEQSKDRKVSDSRTIANAVVGQAKSTLFQDERLDQIISGQGETLSRIIGGSGQVENFKNDFSAGGLLGYISLSNPHNTISRKTGLVKEELNRKKSEVIKNKVDDIQSPQKFLNKERCLEWERDEETKKKTKCLEYKTTTPGGQVSAKINKALLKEEDTSLLAREVSDVLAQALGRLTDGLIQKGFSSLTKAANNTVSDTKDAAFDKITGSFQNEYDVLGLGSAKLSEGGTTSESGSTETGEEGKTSDFGKPIAGDDASTPYIGGPEDLVGLQWNEGPEFIIDLSKTLELAIDKSERKLSLLTNIQSTLRSSTSNIISLDRCIPGPDYNWEERYAPSQGTQTSERGLEDQIGFPQMKQMVSDTKVNIPGAHNALSLVKQSLANTAIHTETGDAFTQISNQLVTFGRIKTDIQNSYKGKSTKLSDLEHFQGHKLTDSNISVSELILFSTEWDKASKAKKLKLASSESVKSYYLFRDNETIETSDDETPELALSQNTEKLKSAVMAMSWDIWRSYFNDTENNKRFKSKLRYEYYLLRNSVTTEAELLELELKKEQQELRVTKIEDVLSDCENLKAYATGNSIEKISAFHKNKNVNIFALRKIFSKDGYGVFGLDVSGSKTEAEVLTFLKNEELNGEAGLLKTSVFTSESAISNSILGFSDQVELDKYFDDLYSDEGAYQYQINNSARTLAKIYQLDLVKTNLGRANRASGTLFCRTRSHSDLSSGGDSDQFSDCLHDRYKISNLEYRAILADI